ncbi:hypothetical protein D3C87_1380170 [compost metagenome]
MFVSGVVFNTDPVTQLVVDLFVQADTAAVLACGTAYPGAGSTAFTQWNTQAQVNTVVATLGAADLPLRRGRHRHATDLGAPGCQGAAAALSIECR